MNRTALLAAAAIGLCTLLGVAAPPGPLDGENIPSNFGAENLRAIQRNYTSFGNYFVEPGGFIEGNETDELYVAKTATHLVVGITGNLATNGNAWIIGLGVPGHVGQTENRTEGEDGPPNTLQDAGREVVVDDNGTPEDGSDDTWSYGATGTIFPVETDYAIAIDVFGGTMSISEYELLDPNGAPDDFIDPTPDNNLDDDQPVFTTRQFVGQTPVNDGNDVLEDNDQGLNYFGGFDNTNVDGVTDTDGSSAATASTGLELRIPFSRLGLSGSETIQVFVLMLEGAGGETNGTVVNQVLPPLGDGAPCDPPDVIGQRPDLSNLMSFVTVNLNTATNFSGSADGMIEAADYGTVKSVQTCPTPFGDQAFDPDALTRGGGSELDALYVTSDAVNLYLGITGNLEENGNRLLIFLDNGADDAGEHILSWDGMGDGGSGMEGDALPPLESDVNTDALFDYVVAINVTGEPPSSDVFVDLWNLNDQVSIFKGQAVMESGNGNLSNGSNQWNMQVALNNLNDVGIIGCGFFENPCWFDSDNVVEDLAMTAQSGFEIAVPLADLGLNPCDGPHDVHVWAIITGGDGWRSNQTIPSARGEGEDAIWQGENNQTDWYVDFFPLPEFQYQAVAVTETTLVGVENDCNENGTEDTCEILDGSALDENLNGVIDDCEQSIAIVSSDPPDGAIDARQPSAPDGSSPAGWDSITLTFDGDASGVTPGDLEITELAGDGIPVGIDSVLVDGNDVTVTFTEFIEVAAWTVITHTPSGTATQIGYLPADVSGDGTSAASDVLSLINALNGIIDLPEYSTDIDRSGVSSAPDVLRTIDLLNGVGVYPVFLGMSLP